MKRVISYAVAVLCLGATAAGMYNVLADNRAVEEMASAAACAGEGPKCRPQMTRLERNAFGQELRYRAGKRTVEVHCARAYYLVGDYACHAR